MRLQTKIITMILTATILVNILIQSYNIKDQRTVALEQLENKMEETNDLLARVNAGPIFYYDIPLIETNIKSFLNDPEIKSIYLIESSGEIDLYFENKKTSTEDLIESEVDVFYEHEKVGRIITTFSRGFINQRLTSLISGMIISIVTISLLLAVILFFILRQIVSPIIKLTELSTAISNGDLDIEIKINTKDEIGILSKSFMKMRDSIKQQIQFLNIENEERKNAEVELRLKTKELAGVNDELIVHKIHLEELVVQRTSELQESLDKLERTKDQLVESEKMASLGDLVAGVAHEINTPVGIGVTAASYLESETEDFINSYKSGELSKSLFEKYTQTAQETSKMILSNMIRAASLIQSFKKVAVDQSSEEKRVFNLIEYIDEVLLSIHSKFKHTQHSILINSTKEISMYSYPGALSQIITNLVINSLQHGFEEVEAGEITIDITQSNNFVNLLYKDNGRGISKNNLKKIFEPFFTTKRGQGGSGLGMNIVYNLVHQSLKGSISCISQIEKGISFDIRLPINLKDKG